MATVAQASGTFENTPVLCPALLYSTSFEAKESADSFHHRQ
jgi:hypothetical protein